MKFAKKNRTCGWLAQLWFKSKLGKKLARRTDLIDKGHIVFEWLPSQYRQRGANPGVGVACAVVLRQPTGESVHVMWSDGEKQKIEKRLLRVAPKPGTAFTVNKKSYVICSYGDGEQHRAPNDKGHGVMVKEETDNNDSASNSDDDNKPPDDNSASPHKPPPTMFCVQCGLVSSGMHECPMCRKSYHATCMLSFNQSDNRMCATCYKLGADKPRTQHWIPDSHLHDPYGNGMIPYCPFTYEYFNRKDKVDDQTDEDSVKDKVDDQTDEDSVKDKVDDKAKDKVSMSTSLNIMYL